MKSFIKQLNKSGDALILTMFIMAGMLIVAMSGAYVVLLGIRAAGVQSQSTKAYYAAEAGAEELLYKFRKPGIDYGDDSGLLYDSNNRQLVISAPPWDGIVANSAYSYSYSVYYVKSVLMVIFDSVGAYQNSQRSVEVRIGSTN